jgi:hypothetical protein
MANEGKGPEAAGDDGGDDRCADGFASRFRKSGYIIFPAERRSQFTVKGRQRGIFRGVIRFEGEQGFTRIAVGHARGFVYRSFKESCKGSSHGGSRTLPIYSLTESAKLHGRTTVFAATKSTEGLPFAGSSTTLPPSGKGGMAWSPLRLHPRVPVRTPLRSQDPPPSRNPRRSRPLCPSAERRASTRLQVRLPNGRERSRRLAGSWNRAVDRVSLQAGAFLGERCVGRPPS